MINWDDELREVLADPFFDDVRAVKKAKTPTDRLIESFQEIITFYKANGREPSQDGDMAELGLFRRLAGIRDNKEKLDVCRDYDTIGLLAGVVPSDGDHIMEDLDSILNDPILSGENEADIFDLPEYMEAKLKERSEVESIAEKEICEDFSQFEAGFKEIHAKLSDGRCKLIKFREADLCEGQYYVVGGMLVYLAYLNKEAKRRDSRNRANDRTRCIYENGTEINVYQQTLSKNLYIDGYTVIDYSKAEVNAFEKAFNVTKADIPSGYIYVLHSLSEDPQIRQIKDLYKIGFTTQTVESRIANAKNEATYLFADVRIVASWQVYNVKASKLEDLIHKLFSNVRLEIETLKGDPKEWFIVPFNVIEDSIKYIISGVPISYDSKLKSIIIEKEK